MDAAPLARLSTIILASLFVSTNCLAEILAFKCAFGGQQIYFTRYSDGTSARVGTQVGVGDKAVVSEHKSGALIFLETNMDGIPVTLTTIEPTMKAVHSRQLLLPDGRVLAPSQQTGSCEKVELR